MVIIMIIEICFAVVFAVSGIAALTRQYQMLQQNSYFAVRYLRWYKGALDGGKVIEIARALIGAFAVAVAFYKDTALQIFLLSLGAVLLLLTAFKANSQKKKSIKKLVVTARVKRMWAAGGVIIVLIASLAVLLNSTVSIILWSVLFLVCALPEIVALLSLLVMKPIEKCISDYYVNDAKKILRNHKNMTVIGVTGSYGKTSTKFILGRILSERYNTLVTPENYNTPMGIVITVRRDLKPQTEIFVCEMGAKRKGDIKEDCKIANPDLGVITSIGPQHLDTFGNIETVVSTKFELADWVKQKNGKMYLNGDNEYIKAKAGEYTSVTYGTSNCDCKAADIAYSPKGLTVTLNYKGEEFKVTSHLLGYHNALNIAAAVSVALDLGLTAEEIAFAVSKLKPTEHRLELKSYINGSTLIDDAYNSNPEGCLEAARVLGCFDGMKKIIVTPGLVELGDREYEANRRLGQEAAKYADVIILVGQKRSVPIAEGIKSQNFPDKNLYVVSSFKEAMGVFSPMLDSDTVILFENDLPDNYLE